MPTHTAASSSTQIGLISDILFGRRGGLARIVLIYALFASGWIVVSERVLAALVSDAATLARWETAKDWLFVAVTSGLLYGLMRQDRRRLVQVTDAHDQSERQLDRSVAQLRWLGDNLPDSYIYQYTHGADGRPQFLYISGGVEKIHQLKAEEVLRDASLLHRQIAAEQLAKLQAIEVENGFKMEDFAQELQITRPDGQQRWLQVRSRPRQGPDGTVVWDGVATDFTPVKHAAEILRLSELKFAQAFANNPAAIALTRLEDGIVLEVNDTWVALTGYSRQEILGHSVRKVWPSAAMAARFVTELREKGIVTGWEQAFQNKAGQTFLTQLSAKLLTLRGEPIILSTLVDITARKEAEEARERQRRHVALLADISGRLVLSDTPGQILRGIFEDLSRELEVDIFANYMLTPEGCGLRLESSGGLTEEQVRDFASLPLGRSLCGVVAQHRQTLIFSDLPKATEPEAAGIIALGVKAYAGFPLLAGTRLVGTVSFGSRRRSAYADGDLRLMRAVADLVVAALERDRLFKALGESDELLRQMSENIDGVFWVTDVAKQKLHYASQGYERIWGRSLQSLYANPRIWLEAIVPEDRERVQQAALHQQATRQYQEEYRVMRPDGTVRWVLDRAFPVRNAAGEVYRVVGSAQDITERKNIEAQFLHSQRLEAIGALASGVAHDLNNILAPVLLVAGLLKETAVTARDQEMLSLIEQSGHRGAGIVRQLLAFSRSGHDEEMAVLVPRHLLHDMVQIMRETFPRNIRIVEGVARDLWAVRADATRLHQVIMNLCVNARDAMPAGGTLTLEAANVMLPCAVAADLALKAGAHVLLRVKDTGQGMPPEIMRRIFEPFFTTKEKGRGTGLGLSTVAAIIKHHGGVVRVESEPERGTVFSVYLPATPGSGGAWAAEPLPVASGRGELILVVDDEPPICEAVRTLLEQQGYRVLAAGSGEEAIKLCIQHQGALRLVLTDMMMPGMDGLDLIRALRVLQPSLPVLASSGLGQQEHLPELQALGVLDVMAKPFSYSVLLKVIDDKLGH